MNAEISRRSACDRCRGQKLRCVRNPKAGDSAWDRSLQQDDEQLGACERCLKAGAECMNALAPQRKNTRAERPPPSSLALTSERRTSLAHFPSDMTTFQHGLGFTPVTGSDVRMKDRPSRISEPPSMPQSRTNFPESFDERPSKRRSIEASSSHLTISHANQFGRLSSSSRPHTSSRNGGSTSSSSLSTGLLETQNFSAEGSPRSKRHDSFSIDDFDFGIRVSPEPAPHHDATAALMNIISTPGRDNPGISVSSGSLNAKSELKPSATPGTPAMESKEGCLNRLSDLSSQLLKDFSKTSSTKLSDVLSFFPCCNSQICICPNNPQGNIRLRNTIGTVLESSQTFLDILKYLKGLSPNYNSDPGSSADSECSYSEYWDENDFLPIGNDLAYDSSTLLPFGDRAKEATNTRKQEPLSGSTVDMPTTLTILTCYTWLLQSYDAIFSRIRASLLSQPKLAPQSIPAILPGLHIGGFDLGDRNDLQIEILIQVSSRMLERIEETLGVNVISQPNSASREKGILDTASASALLDITFNQKDPGNSKRENRSGVLVKHTMDDIREILKGNGM